MTTFKPPLLIVETPTGEIKRYYDFNQIDGLKIEAGSKIIGGELVR